MLTTTHLNNKDQHIPSLNNSVDYTRDLPDEILSTKIFAKLGNLELCRAVCSVSKRWNDIASQDNLWCPWTDTLEIPKEEVKQGENKAKTIEKIIQLKLLIKEADPLLDKRVKTAAEFDMASGAIVYKANPSKEDKQILSQLCDELEEKLEISDKTKKGFYSHLLLRRIGLSDYYSMKKYANKLMGNYGFCEAWQSIAYEYINENHIVEVKDILSLHLEKKDRWPIIARIINDFCSNDQLDQAVQFLEDQLANFRPNQLSKPTNCYELERIIEILLDYAGEKKRFDIYENLITRYIPKDKQKHHLMHLSEELLKEKLDEKAKEIIKTHSEEWEKDQDVVDSVRLIDIYIQIKNYKQAWRLALRKSKEKDLLLNCLLRAFLKAEVPEEAQKVEEMLNLKS